MVALSSFVESRRGTTKPNRPSHLSLNLHPWFALRYTTFHYCIDPNRNQVNDLFRHGGARRFGFNVGTRLVKAALEKRKIDSSVKIPWSGFDLINIFNAWKKTPDAGIDANGKPGLPWQHEVCAQVFEEAMVDLGKSLKAFSDSRKAKRKGKRIGFPRLKKKHKDPVVFRLRNKISKSGNASIRLEGRRLRVPMMGVLKIHDDTRNLRRLLNKGSRILFVTFSFKGDKWYVAINVQATPATTTKVLRKTRIPIGLDRGLTAFIVGADKDANEVERVYSPKPLSKRQKTLRRRNKSLARKKKFSQNWIKAKRKLSKTHAKISNIREDFLQKLTTRLVKTHDHLIIEDLNVAGMIRNRRLSRHIADASWGEFARLLTYKAEKAGSKLQFADRFFPSTSTCSQCYRQRENLKLSERWFVCTYCHFEADRDVNSGSCLAQKDEIAIAAAKRAEALNACGEVSSGLVEISSSDETDLCEAGTFDQLVKGHLRKVVERSV